MNGTTLEKENPMTALTFPTPMPGLAPLRDYTLTALPDTEGVYALASVERPEIRFHVIDASVFLPDYHPALPTGDANNTHLTLVIAQAGREGLVVNLLAPVIVNLEDGTAQQVILHDDADRYPLRAPLAELVH